MDRFSLPGSLRGTAALLVACHGGSNVAPDSTAPVATTATVLAVALCGGQP